MNPNISANASFCPDFSFHISSKSFLNIFLMCFNSSDNMYALLSLCIAHSLFLPLYFLVLYLGVKRCRRQKTTSRAATHSDLITYHSVLMQLHEILGLVIFLCGSNVGSPIIMSVGVYTWGVTLGGKYFFHLLTCVEHYLAVVHPIKYFGLKQARSLRITYTSIGCVWLLSFACLAGSLHLGYQTGAILIFATIGFHLITVLYCSISVLCVLRRPAPGNNKRVDQSKQRAFYTIMAIMAVLFLRLGGNMIMHGAYVLRVFCDVCVLVMSLFWLDFPSTLVLPLLFLYRAGKLPPRKSG